MLSSKTPMNGSTMQAAQINRIRKAQLPPPLPPLPLKDLRGGGAMGWEWSSVIGLGLRGGTLYCIGMFIILSFVATW